MYIKNVHGKYALVDDNQFIIGWYDTHTEAHNDYLEEIERRNSNEQPDA